MKLEKTKILENVDLFTILQDKTIVYLKDGKIYRDGLPLITTQRPSNLRCNTDWITYYENDTRESVVFSSHMNAEVFRFNNVIITLLEEGILCRDRDGLYLRDYTNGDIIWESEIKTKRAINHKKGLIVFHGPKKSIISCLSKLDGSVLWTAQLEYEYVKFYDAKLIFGFHDEVLWFRFSGQLIGMSPIDGKVLVSINEKDLDLAANLQYGILNQSYGIITTGLMNNFYSYSLKSSTVKHYTLNPKESFSSNRSLDLIDNYYILLDDVNSKICMTNLELEILAIEPLQRLNDDIPAVLKPYDTYVLNDTSFVVKDDQKNFHFYEIQ